MKLKHTPPCVIKGIGFVIVLLSSLSHTHLHAQSTEESAVRKVIDTFFEGMKKGDSSLIRNTLQEGVLMATVYRSKENKPMMSVEDTPLPFLEAVGAPHEEAFNEPIWNVVIHIDGDYAQVWCDYAFYLGKNFHHCGVDAFQLFFDGQHWKIFYITDTRRKKECNVPENIQVMFK